MGLHCLLHLPLMPWPHLAPSLCPPSAENVTALCPCSEPGEQCEKGQGWHVPYGILREAWQQWFCPGLAVPQSILWARDRASFSPTSDPGICHVPVQRLQSPSSVAWRSGAVERGDAWPHFPASGQGTEYRCGCWQEGKPDFDGLLVSRVMG